MEAFLRNGNFKRLPWIQPIVDECADLFFDEVEHRMTLLKACGKDQFRDIKFNDEDALRCQKFLNQSRGARGPMGFIHTFRGAQAEQDSANADATEVFLGEKYLQFFDFCATLDCLANLLDFYEKSIAKAEVFGPQVFKMLEKHIPSPSFVPWEFIDKNTGDPLSLAASHCTPFSDKKVNDNGDVVPKDQWDINNDNTYMFRFPFYDIYTSLMCGFFIQYYSTNNANYYGKFVNNCVFHFLRPDQMYRRALVGTPRSLNPNGTETIPVKGDHADVLFDPIQVWSYRDLFVLVNTLMPRTLMWDARNAWDDDVAGRRLGNPLRSFYAQVRRALELRGVQLPPDTPLFEVADFRQELRQAMNLLQQNKQQGLVAYGVPGISALTPVGTLTDGHQLDRFRTEQQNSTQQLTDKPLSVDHVLGVLKRVLPSFDKSKIHAFEAKHAALYSMRHCVKLSEALHETGFLEEALKRFYAITKIFGHRRIHSKANIEGTSPAALLRYRRADGVRTDVLPTCNKPDEVLVLRDRNGRVIDAKDALYHQKDEHGNIIGTYVANGVDADMSECKQAVPIDPFDVGQAGVEVSPDQTFTEIMGVYTQGKLDDGNDNDAKAAVYQESMALAQQGPIVQDVPLAPIPQPQPFPAQPQTEETKDGMEEFSFLPKSTKAVSSKETETQQNVKRRPWRPRAYRSQRPSAQTLPIQDLEPPVFQQVPLSIPYSQQQQQQQKPQTQTQQEPEQLFYQSPYDVPSNQIGSGY